MQNQFLLCMAKCFLRAFVIVPLTFYSSMRHSFDTGCASSSDAQFHRTLLYLCSENKSTDQLWGYCTADLHHCFAYAKGRFSPDVAH